MLTELEKQIYLDRYLNLRLIDNDLMNIAFKNNNKAVEYVIRTILDKQDLTVIKTELQELYALPENNKSVIMDIVATDSNNKVYNIEMQNRAELATEQRARYYCSILDSTKLQKGQAFGELPEVYVIFIVDGPFLGIKDVPIEFFKRSGINTKKTFKDGQTIVYVNAKCNEGETPLASLMRDLTARKINEISSHVLKDAVQLAKGVGGKDMYIEGLNLNQDELLAQGEKKARIEDARNFFKNGASVELISRSLGFSIEQVKDIVGAK